MIRDPMLHVRDQAMRLCETQIAACRAALDLVDAVPRLLLVPAATIADWEARAARWQARAALVDWASRAPAERLPQVVARLTREADGEDAEGQDVAQLVATLRLCEGAQSVRRRSRRSSLGRRSAVGGGEAPLRRRGQAP